MITVEFRRFNGGETPAMTHQKTAAAALTSLVKYEIGFGGRITEVDATRIVACTVVMGCIDTVIFTGSPEEMQRLVRAAEMVTIIYGARNTREVLAESTASVIGGVCKERGEGMRPFCVAHLAPLITGGGVAKVALFAAMDVEDKPTALRLSLLSLDDLVELAEIAQGSGTSLIEAARALAFVA